jgi:hypothetical protein
VGLAGVSFGSGGGGGSIFGSGSGVGGCICPRAVSGRTELCGRKAKQPESILNEIKHSTTLSASLRIRRLRLRVEFFEQVSYSLQSGKLIAKVN